MTSVLSRQVGGALAPSNANKILQWAGEVTADQNLIAYTYDAEGKILTGGTGRYVYDGDGNRVMRTSGGTTVLEWPGVSGVIDLSDSTGTTMAKQVQYGGTLVWSESVGAGGRFVFQDHLGSTRVTADAVGNLEDDADYLPFGTMIANYGTASSIPYVFTGYESDVADSGTDYAIFRNQNMAMGRFNRPDPYDGSYDFTNPQTLNRYSYTMNNPLGYVDPSGLATTVTFVGQCVVIAVGYGGFDDTGTYITGVNETDICYGDSFYGGTGGGVTGGGHGGNGSSAKSAPSNCPAGPANVYNFIHTNQAAANSLAQQSGVNADYLLGLSGWESQWGANRFAAQGNNFFSLHGGSSAPFANGSMQASRPPYVSLSTFPSYFASGQSFLAQYGNGLAGATSPAAFAQQLINNHFNSGNAATGGNPNFLSNTVTGINMVIRRKGC